MNKLLLLLYILFSLNCFSQAKKIKIKKMEKEKPVKAEFYNHASLDLYYGNRVYDKSYYNQINAIDNIDLKTPPTFVGIGFSGYPAHVVAINRTSLNIKWMLWQGNYYKIIPNQITIEDSLNTKLSGYAVGLGFGAALATRKENLSLTAYIGFNTGRTTLSKNEFISQKNQFFAPKITIQPKFIVKQIALSFIVECEYDISNPMWRQTIFERKEPHLLKPFNQTCLTGIVSLGYRFAK